MPMPIPLRRVLLFPLVASTIIISALYLLQYTFNPPLSPRAHPPPAPPPANVPPPSERHVHLTQGRWQPLPLTEQDETALASRFGSQGPACFPAWQPVLEDLTVTELERRAKERALDVARWEWVPASGSMKEWDIERVLERLVNSEKGLMLVGDSITGQMAETLYSMLLIPPRTSDPSSSSPPPLLLRAEHHTAPPHHALDSLALTLNPLHPLTLTLQHRLPHVPRSRFAAPIVRFLRNDLLLPFADLELLFAAAGVRGWVGEKAGFFAQRAWLSLLPRGRSGSGGQTWAWSWPGEQPSVLVLNTGAHWTPDHFYMPEGQYTLGYAAAVRALLPRLLAVPRLHLIYRSISPAHTRCHASSAPVFPGAGPEPELVNPAWGWLQFPILDRLWREEMDARAPEGVSADGGRVDWLDVGEMGRQRPDAHLLGEDGMADCMHWCGPSVPGTWVRMVWELIGEE